MKVVVFGALKRTKSERKGRVRKTNGKREHTKTAIVYSQEGRVLITGATFCPLKFFGLVSDELFVVFQFGNDGLAAI